MFWIGLVIGLIIGVIITMLSVRFSINYIMEHEELFDQMLEPPFNQIIKKDNADNFFMTGV